MSLHIIEQHGNWSTQHHVVHDMFGTNVFIIFIFHKDGQKVMSEPGHLLRLRGEHTDTLGVRPEDELSVSGKQRRAPIITSRLGGDEGVNLQSHFCDKHAEAPFAVVAHLACSAGVSHFVLSDCCDWSGQHAGLA